MTRIAIVGANGQVGAEVSLRLSEVSGVEVVPVVRNVSGSAFLRLNGMDCRHGRIADPAEAKQLIGDCDVVMNFALSMTAVPRIDRERNRAIVRGIVAGAKPGATIVFASTVMVYAPELKVRLPESYGLEKLIAERLLRKLCRRSKRPLFVFRLGHVLGDLQNITRKIQGEIAEGKVALPDEGSKPSNTVFTSTIVEALLQAANGRQSADTYDLITAPQWSWHDVYSHYASQLGVPLALVPGKSSRHANLRGSMHRTLQYLRRNELLRQHLMFLLAFMPHDVNRRVHLRYLQSRAMTEIGALRQAEKIDFCVPEWRELKLRPMPGLPDPRRWSCAIRSRPRSIPRNRFACERRILRNTAEDRQPHLLEYSRPSQQRTIHRIP